jgi:hypothetical protein
MARRDATMMDGRMALDDDGTRLRHRPDLPPLPGLAARLRPIPTACAVGWNLPPLPRLGASSGLEAMRVVNVQSNTKRSSYSTSLFFR